MKFLIFKYKCALLLKFDIIVLILIKYKKNFEANINKKIHLQVSIVISIQTDLE